MNKNYRKGYMFQRRVVKFLRKKGFNCVTQPKSAFPDIIAWRPLMDQEGNNLKLHTQMQNGKVIICLPFFVSMVECKVNKHLTKQEKQKAKDLLEKGVCNVFLIAYRVGRKLEFQEFFLKPKELKNERTQNYIG